LVPVVASAQAQELPPASPNVQTVEQARQAFSGAGYTVDAAHTWDWTSPSFSSFQVHDTTRDRVLIVLVYPSAAAAETARLQAASHEQSLNGGEEVGPHLVIGYGPSTWSGNVAMVQTTGSNLHWLYQARLHQDSDLHVDPDLVQ